MSVNECAISTFRLNNVMPNIDLTYYYYLFIPNSLHTQHRRMSFDMFQPGNLICSVQSTHNTIKIVGEREELPTSVPSSLKEEVSRMCDSNGDSAAKRPLLRSYE